MIGKLLNFFHLSRGKEISRLTGLALDDGDVLNIDFQPTNYIPQINPLTTEENQLTSHLYGIDNKINNLSGSIDFGLDYNFVENKEIFSTTSTNYQQANRLDFILSSDGNYRISWFYEWNYNSIDSTFDAKVELDDVEIFGQLSKEPKENKQINTEYGFITSSILQGSHFIDLDIKSTNPKKEATVFLSRIELFKIN